MAYQIIFVFLLLVVCKTYGQTASDTVSELKEIVVTVYPAKRPLFRAAATVSIINEQQLKLQPGFSLVPALNSLPGVRMEERSPGSYRLSIRGSLLRSPFGIRNVKIYMDEFPLTDAGGNTYLNALDAGSIHGIEVLKGPEGSVFGANTGGVVIIHPSPLYTDTLTRGITNVHLSGGSYSLFQERLSWKKNWKKYQVNLDQNYQRSDGYRVNSGMRRTYLQAVQSWQYVPAGKLKLITLYADLNYRTPGGLTQSQFISNPRAARQATATLPGAEQQKAGVVNKTFFGGLSHDFKLSKNFKHVTALFGSHTDFKNPFIVNYEVRKENTIGVRTFLDLDFYQEKYMKLNWNLGLEWQQTRSDVRNYGNRSGNKDTAQIFNQITARQYFYFTRLTADIGNHLNLEAALSLNYYNYNYRNTYPFPQAAFNKNRSNGQLLPRIAASFKVSEHLVWRASASRGYSSPTISEILPSDNLFYTTLQAESGWNYETGLRIRTNTDLFWADAVIFYYKLNHAIVRRQNEQGQEYFINSGGTKQPGLESQLTVNLLKGKPSRIMKAMVLRNSFTYYHFSFKNYSDASNNYSGNNLTGVPPYVLVSSLHANFLNGFYLFIQHNYTDRLPLNDANTFHANGYHLVQLKVGWNQKFNSTSIELFTGADNLLGQKYSLGNDLNAAGNRFFNAAPVRNFFAGINLNF